MSNDLTKVSDEQRDKFIGKNVFNGEDDKNGYGIDHTRAKADTETPVQGKNPVGAAYLQTTGIEAGGALDINGAPEVPKSGRKQNLAQNDFGTNKRYYYDVFPELSKNKGQYKVK